MRFQERQTLTTERSRELYTEIRETRARLREELAKGDARCPHLCIALRERDEYLRQVRRQRWEYVTIEVTSHAGLLPG